MVGSGCYGSFYTMRGFFKNFYFIFFFVMCVCVCVKRSGERKRPTFHPPRPRTICVQPDKYWHCFEGNLGETAKRRGGARMGLSERYDAILS